MNAESGDELVLDEGIVHLSQNRLVVEGKGTYRVRDIQSASKSVDANEPEKYWVGVVIFVGALWTMGAVWSFFDGTFLILQGWGDWRLAIDVNIWGSLAITVVCALIVLGGIGEWQNRKTVTRYWLHLSMSSGQNVVFEVLDDVHADLVISALSDVMVS